jgi:very-short-patch-repair endonuclease/superfamily II DNA or RNA helicase
MTGPTVGSIVKCREREWIVLPSDDPEVAYLRPLTGGEREVCAVYLPLGRFGLDRVEAAEFPLPVPAYAGMGDATGVRLLWDAARLTLRDGAGPFRSLGRISVRPRAYQFVPLLMALRLDPVRMLIADDVGVGKTIEALLVARELLDRGDVQRLCVVCPPYLCDQWQQELWDKFQLDAVVVRSGTVSRLERELTAGQHSVFGYYRHLVVSIDYAKSDAHRANFLQHCPELVIVDEAHGAARPAGGRRAQHERHELLRDLAQDGRRHLLLLTATPHSGIEESFLSLLGLIRPEFGRLDLRNLGERQRSDLARHFVQRRRADVERWLGEDTPFPKRVPAEETYDLSPEYQHLFNQVYQFSRELVRSGQTLSGWKQRIRFWSALALLRCVMSSPAAAQAALLERTHRGDGEGIDLEADDDVYAPYIFEPTDEDTLDTQPAHIVEESEREIGAGGQGKLRQFARQAAALKGSAGDRKTTRLAELVAGLLAAGQHPIVWCRYIATSDYVAEQLQQQLADRFPRLRVLSITGALADDERRARVAELGGYEQRVLVATDCLSEGINLQQWFSAVVHYDLPWNPNRLEQREGRVDRFGQTARQVQTILLYGRDNPVDGAVLDVLLRKATEIHRALGVSVPVPRDSETVMEAVLNALFFRSVPVAGARQLALFEDEVVKDVHREWDRAAAREKESRTRFAQHAIKPDEVQRELEATDAVLGDPTAVRSFVLNACQRLGATVTQAAKGSWTLGLALGGLPESVRSALPAAAEAAREWHVGFDASSPAEGVTILGRNHPFVAGLAQYLFEAALAQDPAAPVARAGALRTHAVTRRTTLLLLRLRCLIEEPGKPPQLAEEMVVTGWRGLTPQPNALTPQPPLPEGEGAHGGLPSPSGRGAGGEGSSVRGTGGEDSSVRGAGGEGSSVRGAGGEGSSVRGTGGEGKTAPPETTYHGADNEGRPVLQLPPYIRDLCRNMRRGATSAEAFLWECLRNRRFEGLKFRRQHAIGRYIVDFYCHECRLAVEAVGGVHDRPDVAAYDRHRKQELAAQGIRVVVVSNAEVLGNPEAALRKIADAISLTPQPPLPEGEGARGGLPSPSGRGAGGEGSGARGAGGEGSGVRGAGGEGSGVRGAGGEGFDWLSDAEALQLLQTAAPEAAITPEERRQQVTEALERWPAAQAGLNELIERRVAALAEAHRRVRAAAGVARRGLEVRPASAPDLLGILVLVPLPPGVKPAAAAAPSVGGRR